LPSDPTLRHPGGTAPFRLILSSGTTGEPKGLSYGHDAWLSSEAMDAPYNRFAIDDRYLMSIPPSIAIGLSYCMRIVVCGGMIVIPPADIDPDRYFDTIDRYGITRLVFTPSGLYQILLHAPPDTPRLPGLRQLLALTATVPETLRSEVRKRLSPNLVVRYSTNEFGTLTYADAETQAGHPETVGRPIRGLDVEVVDAAGTPLPAGETGLIRARGRPFPHRYFRNPEATGKVFRDGWYYPGDLGCFHPDGALFLKGRADDLMNFQGLKIFPADIENILLQHPGVAEAAAFPLESAQRQDLPAAVVVLRDPAVTPGQLIAFCRERLGARAPAYVATAAGMPRNSSGKVLKRELAKIVEARLQQRGHVL
jgi:acyl-coenzyme A synthetase/AMP-(fatty) acid ligase